MLSPGQNLRTKNLRTKNPEPRTQNLSISIHLRLLIARLAAGTIAPS